jgi:hypothetical protein
MICIDPYLHPYPYMICIDPYLNGRSLSAAVLLWKRGVGGVGGRQEQTGMHGV